MRTLRPLWLALLASLLVPALAPAQSVPSKRVLYANGPTDRHLMDGPWLLRKDPGNAGLRQGWHRQGSAAGWERTRVPSSWNAGDDSPESMRGGVAWYRKDFRLPSRASRLAWIVRFESVNYRARVWLNGKLVGTNKGAYLPFEIRLPQSVVKRNGTNRLVLRVDNVRLPTDFPPSGLSRDGIPIGGWWNYGGLLREVYLRRVDRVAFNTVQVHPELPCRTCAATVRFRVTLRNFANSAQRVRLSGRFGGQRIPFRAQTVGAKRFVTFTARVRVGRPRLWSPKSPQLYRMSLGARVGDRTVSAWRLNTGIRSIKVSREGRLLLNGLPINPRGVGLHEDSRDKGLAIGRREMEAIVKDTKDLGATIMRGHYPFHPYMHELADRQGLMVWSEIPVYAIKTQYLKRVEVRKMAANELRDNILANGHHPSIFTWSVGNELSARPGPVQADYLARAARQAKQLDPTRPISYAVAAYPSAGCRPQYKPLDIVGFNDYFGWYPGPNGQIADRNLLSEYLDSLRACYPDKALMITEFGAEANRDGPVEERGTYAHQQDFVNFHLGVFATKPWLNGAIYWALKEFRVRPEWSGGNPRPNPPFHEKGLVEFDGGRKPAFFDAQRLFRSVDQYPGQTRRAR